MSGRLAEALAKLDQVLAGRPRADPHLLTEATQTLCAERDARAAGGASRAELEPLNAVISVVLAAHYPVGGTPWSELEAARGWLAGL